VIQPKIILVRFLLTPIASIPFALDGIDGMVHAEVETLLMVVNPVKILGLAVAMDPEVGLFTVPLTLVALTTTVYDFCEVSVNVIRVEDAVKTAVV
jgi:hypothetical protein